MTILVQTKLQKSSAPFRPFFEKFTKSSAADFPGPTQLFSAPFVVCGRNFGPVATMVATIAP
jgi:hypothetical protein